MKKILCKSLSIFLALITLFTAIPMLVSAEAAETPEFVVEKASETPTSLELVIKLKSGSFVCFDAFLTVKDLKCTAAYTTDEFDAFVKSIKKDGEQAADCTNTENGKISISVTKSCTAPMDIAVYTFTKNESTGVNGSDVSFVFSDCYVDNGENDELDVTSNIKADILLPATHVHNGDSWTVVTPATCSAEGKEELYCTECGELADSRSIPKTEHQNTQVTLKEATCTEDGYRDIYCLDCGEQTWHAVLPATGHVKTHEEVINSTCTSDGYRKVICDKCNAVVEETIYPATNHANTHTENVEATCTTDGYIRVVCDDCKTIISETKLPAKGHGATTTKTTPATCTVNGSIDEICTVCNQIVKSTPIIATGHPSFRMEQKAATCTQNGYVRYYCEKCGELAKDNVIKSTGHKKVTKTTDANCHNEGSVVVSCTVCHEVFSTDVLPKTKHSWSAWKTDKEATAASSGLMSRTCKICGDREENTIPPIPVPVKDITVSVKEITINFKKTDRIYANLTPAEAAYSNPIVWKSSNKKVADVDENGVITATGKGTAIITASTPDGKVTDTCKVTVTYSWIQVIIIYVLFGWIWYM